MVAKANQATLRDQVCYQFHLCDCFDQPPAFVETLELSHGRIERRRLSLLAVTADDVDWPHVAQVFRIERHVQAKLPRPAARHRKTPSAVPAVTVDYGVTSLPDSIATAPDLYGLLRGHWSIENRSHWVRDVTLGEDKSLKRQAYVAQVTAALRNATLAVMRLQGKRNIAAACRFFAARPWEALQALGISPRQEDF